VCVVACYEFASDCVVHLNQVKLCRNLGSISQNHVEYFSNCCSFSFFVQFQSLN
jgi:hypothetical protein